MTSKIIRLYDIYQAIFSIYLAIWNKVETKCITISGTMHIHFVNSIRTFHRYAFLKMGCVGSFHMAGIISVLSKYVELFYGIQMPRWFLEFTTYLFIIYNYVIVIVNVLTHEMKIENVFAAQKRICKISLNQNWRFEKYKKSYLILHKTIGVSSKTIQARSEER